MGRAPLGRRPMTDAERQRRHRMRLAAEAAGIRPPPPSETLVEARGRIASLLKEIRLLHQQLDALTLEVADLRKAGKPSRGPTFTRAQLAALLFALHPDHARHADIAEKRRQALQLVAERMKPRRK